MKLQTAFSILTLFLVATASLAGIGDSGLPEGYETYQARPDILTLKPKAQKGLGPDWDKLRRAHAEAAAMLLEQLEENPQLETYVLGRDGEYLYDLIRYLSKNRPALLSRIHLLNISSVNVKDPHLLNYLAQNGITKESLSSGKEILLADTGFNGTIPEKIEELFPDQNSKIHTVLMASNNSKYPSNRGFLSAIHPDAATLHPSTMQDSIDSYEHLPRYTERSTHFAQVNGEWQAISPKTENGIDGVVSSKRALLYMQDLIAYADAPETRKLIEARRSEWKTLNQLKKSPNHELLSNELKRILASRPGDPFAEALVRDFVEMQELHHASRIPLEGLGLKPITFADQSNLAAVIRRHPEWRTILQNPSTGLTSLIQVGNYPLLKQIQAEVRDENFTNSLCAVLLKNIKRPEIQSFVENLILERDPQIHRALAEYFPEADSPALKKLLRLLVKTSYQDARQILLSTYLVEHPQGSGDFIKTILKEATPETKTIFIEDFLASFPPGSKKYLAETVETGDQGELKSLASFVFSQPESTRAKDLLKRLIERADQSTLGTIATHVFTEDHAKKMGDLFKLMIDRMDRRSLDSISHLYRDSRSEMVQAAVKNRIDPAVCIGERLQHLISP